MPIFAFVRDFFRSGRSDKMPARISAGVGKPRPRVIALETLRISQPRTPEDYRAQLESGRVAEMSARQAGL